MSIFSTWATIQKLEAVVNDLTTLASAIQGTAAWGQLEADIQALIASFKATTGSSHLVTACPPCMLGGTGAIALVSALFSLYTANSAEIDSLLSGVYDLLVKAKADAGM